MSDVRKVPVAADVEETRMCHEIAIARPPAEVLGFASDARQWPAWHPSSVGVRGPHGSPRSGDVFHEVVQVGPVRGEIAWRVLESTAGRLSFEGHVDFPLMRRTRVIIAYEVSKHERGTTFRREMRYVPRQALSRLADRLFFRRHNEEQSRVALRALRRAVEGAPRP